MVRLEQIQGMKPSSPVVGEDVHRQLLALRNYKALQLIAQQQDLFEIPWLSQALELAGGLSANERNAVLNHPAVYAWIETARFVSGQEPERQAVWRAEGYRALALQLWLRTGAGLMQNVSRHAASAAGELFLFNRWLEVPGLGSGAEAEVSVEGDTLRVTAPSVQTAWTRQELFTAGAGTDEFFCNRAPWIDSYLQLITPADLRMEKIELVPAVSEDMHTLFTGALDLIRTHWPEMHEELASNVRRIVMFEPPGLPFFSDFRVHGTIFAAHMNRPLLKVAEWLVHEASHIRLNTLMCARPHLVGGMEAVYPSPWRDELRPLFGIYHGCFVHSRVLTFYRLLQEQTSEFAQECAEEIARIREEVRLGLESVRDNGELTEDGVRLWEEMYGNL